MPLINKLAMPCNTDKDFDQHQNEFASVVNEFGTEVLAAEHWKMQYHFSNSVAGTQLRDKLAKDITEMGYMQPAHNI
jgi:hypothetical protein